MYREHKSLRIVETALISLSCISVVLYETDLWFILLSAAAAVAAFVVPSFFASGIPNGRLKRLSYGNCLLWAFPPSLILCIAAFVYMIAGKSYGAGLIVAYAVITLILLNLYFWTGIILVYVSSVQLGIDKRVIGLLCGMIPVANLIALNMIVRTTGREVKAESVKHWINEGRKGERICATKYPIVMVHGVFFRDIDHLNYWGRIPGELERNGARIFYGGQESAGDVKSCAAQLKETVESIVREEGCSKVNIIAHSKGGLDSRYAISMLGMAPYVASLTTINTPHRGCEFADYILSKAPSKLKETVAAAYNRGALVLGDKSPDFIAAVTDLTSAGTALLNEEMSVNDRVWDKIFTQSFGSKLNRAGNGKFPLNLSYNLVKYFDGNNDGLVGEKSFCWGSSFTFLTHEGKRGISHADMREYSGL